MIRRPLALLATVSALWLVVACLDVSSPVSGILAITPVLLPTPSVVVGDTSRDTTGAVARLRVLAFGPHGDTLKANDINVVFIAIDSTQQLTVDSLTGLAYGGSMPSSLARVVARVTPSSGKGVIQTLSVPLPVVPKPILATKDTDFSFTFDPGVTDTFSTALASPAMNVTVHGTPDTTIQSYVVSYQIVRRPPSKDGQPSVVIYDRSGNDSTVAVTGSGGVASRQLRVRVPSVSNDLLLGVVEDTVVVKFHVRYRDTFLPVSPTDSFVIVLRSTERGR
jgi:hypothetical protein